MHWRYKATVQNAIGRLPPNLGDPIYYQLQCRFGGLRHPTPLSRLAAGVEVIRRIQQFGRSAESAVFLEIGTGHQMALPLSLWLGGASEITTVDLNRYLKERLVMNDLEYMRQHKEEVREIFRGISTTRSFEQRFQLLLAGPTKLDELFSLANIRYFAPADASCLPLPARSVDYHISFTVLEHIPPAVLRRILQEGARLLKPAGLFVHNIDFTDHFAHSDKTIPSINFLQFSEHEWQGLAGNRYMFHNRLRLDEFQDLLTDLDLEVMALDSQVDGDAVELLNNGFPLSGRFQRKDPVTNAAKDAWVVAMPRGSR